MKHWMIFYQGVLVALHTFGMIVGIISHQWWLLIWCAIWGYFSCWIIDRIKEEYPDALHQKGPKNRN
jgi:hypothetical protein